MVFNNPTDRPASFVEQDNEVSSSLVRLVQDPDVEKTIRFDEMSIDAGPEHFDTQGGDTKMGELGLVYPMIRINDVILALKNIKSIIISCSDFIPTIRIDLIYEDSVFISKNMPKDGDMISLFIRTDSDAMQYLRDDFIITSCSSTKGSKGSTISKISISGKLFIPGFDSKSVTEGYTGSSKSILKKMAKSLGIGFAFNDYDDTDDFQNWIRCREQGESFVNSVTLHAWKNETSFFKSWIDLYYNLCFVNINKFLLSDENNEVVDVTFATNILNMYNQLTVDSSIANAQVLPKILSNASEFSGTPFYIERWDPINNSTSVSFSKGYETVTRAYLHNQNIINNNDNDCFSTLENIPAYDQTKTDYMILLRGRSKYEAGQNPDNEQARVNYDFVNTYTRDIWTGVEYILSDDDENKDSMQWAGNVHKNYNNAPYHNSQNLNELNKIYLKVQCQGLCLQIMKGERVPVYLIHGNTLEADKYNTFSDNDVPTDLNRFYTGYYIVDSIEYKFAPIKEGDISPYKTIFILKRREWPTPEAI